MWNASTSTLRLHRYSDGSFEARFSKRPDCLVATFRGVTTPVFQHVVAKTAERIGGLLLRSNCAVWKRSGLTSFPRMIVGTRTLCCVVMRNGRCCRTGMLL